MNRRLLVSGFAAIMVVAAPAMASTTSPVKAQAAANCTGLTGAKLHSCTAKLHAKTAAKPTSSMAAPVKPVKKY